MPAKPGDPQKKHAGSVQRKPKGKPALSVVPMNQPVAKAPVIIDIPEVEPLYDTYSQPKPEGAYFDEDAADRAVNFIQNLRHYSGVKFAGTPFILLYWQDRLVREIFGWRNADGTRLYRKVYLEIARKAGKTALAAAIALYLAYDDDEPAARVYFAAADKDQSGECYGAARIFAEQDIALGSKSVFYNSTKRIIIPENPGAELRCLSADIRGKYGLNVHGLVADELMAWPNRTLWDALTTASGARTQPLTIAITTAGWERHSVAYEHRDLTRRISQGKENDPTFLGVIYSAPETDDWTQPETWQKANPSLGHTVDLKYYEDLCKDAIAQPSAQNSFRTLMLSQWVGQETRLLPMADWTACGEGWNGDPEGLEGAECFGGLDLSATTDLSAYQLVFATETDAVKVITHLFIPEAGLYERGLRDDAPYMDWVRDGVLIATPGKTIHYPTIKQTIRESAERFKVVDISYDRWGANQLTQELEADRFVMVEMGQGFASMASPTKEFIRLVAEHKFWHGGHPVLEWMADHVAGEMNPAGDVKLAKNRSTTRIDGLVASVMGLDGLKRRGSVKRRSVYAERGAVFV